MIGTGVMLVWTVIGRFLPLSGAMVWVSSGVSLLLYAGVGVLAGRGRRAVRGGPDGILATLRARVTGFRLGPS